MRLFVDNLTNVDFSYLHAKRGIVGETWLANIELIGELDEQGMICDFGIVKKMLRNWLDTEIDHRLVVPLSSPNLIQLDLNTSCTKLEWAYSSDLTDDVLTMQSPQQAICAVETTEITPESVAAWCIEQLKPLFPSSVIELKLTFTIEPINAPFYHYSHGLKKHDGNCQRIAHGHRSKIEIWENDQLNIPLMQVWAERWQDIYIGSESDEISVTGLKESHIAFAYTAQQGDFFISLPKRVCYLMNTDTTVELIAQHIAQQLKTNEPINSYRVKAYEGLSKGAIVDL